MDNPENANTKSVIQSIKPDTYEEVWDILDQIFNSYASEHAIKQIYDEDNPQMSVRRNLQVLLDDYTQDELFKSVSNLIQHIQSHKFSIGSTMKIDFYQKNKYKTIPLPFYDDDDEAFDV